MRRAKHLKFQITVLALAVLSLAGAGYGSGWPDTENRLSSDHLAGIPIHATPAGTFLRYGDATVFLPGAQLPEQLLTVLQQASVTVVTRKVAHVLLTIAMGHADKFLGRPGYDFLVSRYKDGSLMIPVNFWQYWVRLNHLWRGAVKVTEELGRRSTNIMGTKRTGRMPVYPGPELDQAVFIDVLLSDESGEGGQHKLELVPIHSVDERIEISRVFSPWQKTVAQLVNAALARNVDFIRLAPETHGDITMEWHQQSTGTEESEWQKNTLHIQAGDSSKGELLSWLPDSYNKPVAQMDLVSALEPAGLSCVISHFSHQNIPCEPLAGLNYQWSLNGLVFEARQKNASAGFIQIFTNRSWSPGLPGTMALVADPSFGLKTINSSRQFRMPEWAVSLGEALLYEVAVTLAENTVGAALEKMNRWWHGAGSYEFVTTFKGGLNARGQAQADVKRIKDKRGKTWIRKSAQWFDAGRSTPENSLYLTLAKERQILSELNSPHIVKVHDSWIENAGTTQARLVLIEEDGGNKSTRDYPRDIPSLRKFMKGSLEALKSVHQMGMAHFDIKPDNILVGESGQIKLADFGEAVHLDKSGRGILNAFTPEFVAPETVTKSSNVPWQADLWSLGTAGVQFASALGIPAAGAAWQHLSAANRERKPFSLARHMSPSDDPEHGQGLVDFLGQMLVFDYKKRSHFTELLEHPFIAP